MVPSSGGDTLQVTGQSVALAVAPNWSLTLTLNCSTMAVTGPSASRTTAYCTPSDSPDTVRGSTRLPAPGTSPVRTCCVTSRPSLNRYQRSDADVGPQSGVR